MKSPLVFDQHDLLLALGVGFIACFVLTPFFDMVLETTYTSTKEIKNINTAIMSKGMLLSKQLSHNSDLMMRYSHYTTPHPEGEQQMGCPECGDNRTRHMHSDNPPSLPPVSLPDTMGQLERDAHEINNLLGTYISCLQHQETALSFHLDALRKQDKDRTNERVIECGAL